MDEKKCFIFVQWTYVIFLFICKCQGTNEGETHVKAVRIWFVEGTEILQAARSGQRILRTHGILVLAQGEREKGSLFKGPKVTLKVLCLS